MSDDHDHAFHLTPLDVRSQEFARTLRGYDRAQVDEFKLAISEELERLLRDRAQECRNSCVPTGSGSAP